MNPESQGQAPLAESRYSSFGVNDDVSFVTLWKEMNEVGSLYVQVSVWILPHFDFSLICNKRRYWVIWCRRVLLRCWRSLGAELPVPAGRFAGTAAAEASALAAWLKVSYPERQNKSTEPASSSESAAKIQQRENSRRGSRLS